VVGATVAGARILRAPPVDDVVSAVARVVGEPTVDVVDATGGVVPGPVVDAGAACPEAVWCRPHDGRRPIAPATARTRSDEGMCRRLRAVGSTVDHDIDRLGLVPGPLLLV
jgi:hypothetical protein